MTYNAPLSDRIIGTICLAIFGMYWSFFCTYMIMEIVGSMVDAAIMCFFYDKDSLLHHSTPEGQHLGQLLNERMDTLVGLIGSSKRYRVAPKVPQSMQGTPPPGAFTVTCPPNKQAGDTIHVAFPDGNVNEVVVPKGVQAGQTFSVGICGAHVGQQI